jgi:hypothetical protein
MKKMFNKGNQIHNFMSSSGSGTVINYGYGSGSDFLTSYGSGYGSGSTSQKVTVPTVPVPVPQHCLSDFCRFSLCTCEWERRGERGGWRRGGG